MTSAIVFQTSEFLGILIIERRNGVRDLILLNGASKLDYWIGTFLVDVIKMIIPIVMFIFFYLWVPCEPVLPEFAYYTFMMVLGILPM
jgi:hypothetical protein